MNIKFAAFTVSKKSINKSAWEFITDINAYVIYTKGSHIENIVVILIVMQIKTYLDVKHLQALLSMAGSGGLVSLISEGTN